VGESATNTTSVRFTVETPPAVGVEPGLVAKQRNWNCGTCTYLMSYWYEERKVTAEALQPLNAPWTAFHPYEDPSGPAPDMSQLTGLRFAVSGGGDFDFCISDLAFLDAEGAVVAP